MGLVCWPRGILLLLLVLLLRMAVRGEGEAGDAAAVPNQDASSGLSHDAAGQGAPDEDTNEAKAARFNQWIAEHYESPPYLEVRPVPGMRFGAFAKADIQVGQIYSSTPASLLINREAIRQSDKAAFLKAGLDGALLLFLLVEKAKGAASFWHPYIALLPTMEDYQALPSYWPEEELTEVLNNTLCFKRVMDGKAEEQNEYSRLKEFLEKWDPEMVPAFTFDEFKWARTVRDSRTIWLQGRDRQFVPMLDMVNCKHHQDQSKVHRTTYGPKGSADTPALWAFKAGKEVFENYGQTNLFYYQYHGFTIANNAYDCYSFNFSHLADTISRWGIQNGHKLNKFEFCVAPQQQIPQDLLAIFAAQATMKKKRSRLMNKDADRGLEKFLKSTAAAIPGDATTDTELVKSPDTAPRLKAAIRYRKSERRLLEKVLKGWNMHRFSPRPIPRPDEL